MDAVRTAVSTELPPPSAELVLIRVFVQAHLATAPKRQAKAFLRHAISLLETEESVAQLFPIRPEPRRSELSSARREAIAHFKGVLPVLIASLEAR